MRKQTPYNLLLLPLTQQTVRRGTATAVLLRQQEHDQPEINGLGRQQLIALGTVGQREDLVLARVLLKDKRGRHYYWLANPFHSQF